DESIGRYCLRVFGSSREVLSAVFMDEKPPRLPKEIESTESALTPHGPHSHQPLMAPDPNSIHVAPEMAIAEQVMPEEGGYVRGTSLWRDAWRRLLKNKLAVFGLVVVVLITILSIIGP